MKVGELIDELMVEDVDAEVFFVTDELYQPVKKFRRVIVYKSRRADYEISSGRPIHRRVLYVLARLRSSPCLRVVRLRYCDELGGLMRLCLCFLIWLSLWAIVIKMEWIDALAF